MTLRYMYIRTYIHVHTLITHMHVCTPVYEHHHLSDTCLQTPFFNILVPTIDTKRYGFLMERLLDVGHSILFTGTTGVGKVHVCVYTFVEYIDGVLSSDSSEETEHLRD